MTEIKNIKKRCEWVTSDSVYVDYHDREWGVPVHEDRKHFEFLILEAAQAGLSWLTVLKKREGYRRAFSQFDPKRVSKYNASHLKKLLVNAEIVRNKLKLEAAIHNARLFLKIQEEFGSFDAYCWKFVGGSPKMNQRKTFKSIPPMTKESDTFSKDLKMRGFKFIGSTLIYAHMQAVGMVNDHSTDCFRYSEICGLLK
jgi:DNA-3-methyladenine glycosylase I